MRTKFPSTLLITVFMLFAMASKAGNGHLHQKWVKCLLVNILGDTTKCEVKDRKDYSAEGGTSANNELIIRYADGHIEKLDLQVFRELIVFGKPAGYSHYISLNINHVDLGRFMLYRIITEGVCKLLYREVPASAGKMIQTANGFGYDNGLPPQLAHDEYDIYYNNKLTMVYVDDDLNLIPKSKRD